MQEVKWILKSTVLAIHSEQLAEHGGIDGIRDEGLLDSALSRPIDRCSYDRNCDLYDIAASYAYGLSQNHAFFDGNKRTAFVVSFLFLKLHNIDITASLQDRALTFLDLAGGKISEQALAQWFRVHSKKV